MPKGRRDQGPYKANGIAHATRFIHGLTAKHLVVQDRDGAEHQAEYNRLLISLRECFKPQGVLEEMWVEEQLAQRRDGLEQQKIRSEELRSLLPQIAIGEADSLTDHLALPTREDIDRLLRYEAMIDKQMQRALDQLNTLQRCRKSQTE